MKLEVKYICEDTEELKIASSAMAMYIAIDDFRNYLRQQWKYAETPDDINKIYDRFNEIFNDHF